MRYEPWPRAVLANSVSGLAARGVLSALAAGCSPDGFCSLSLGELAHLTALSISGVRKGLAELIRIQEVRIMQPAVGRSVAVYQITIARVHRFSQPEKRRRVSPHQTPTVSVECHQVIE